MDTNQYLSIFIDESNDHLQSLNENILRLEQQPDDIDIVQVIFRSAHTLKGMSAAMGFEDLASLTHEMENVLDLVRNGKLSMNDHMFDALFRCLDALEAMVQDVIKGGTGSGDVAELVERLKSIVTGDAENNTSESSSSASADIPANLILDQFQLSVLSQSLESGHRVYYIEVKVQENCILKAARAYMVFDVLERNGEVVKAHPSVEEIEQEKFGNSFAVYYISQVDEAELRDSICRVSEIESVTITAVDKSSLSDVAHSESYRQPAADAVKETAAASASAAVLPSTAVIPARSAVPAAAGGGAAAARTIRVDIERLDSLMNLLSELLIDRVRLEQLSSEVKRGDLTETVEHMARVSADLQNIVLKMRMVPVDSVFNRFPRMVRDVAKSLGKKVDLVITGADTELDRTVIDEIGDPLVHLIRNAVDHGLESISERTAAGKPETGTVHLRAYHSGNHVFIEIEEDGKGIDRAKVLQTAVKRGIVPAEEASSLSEDQVNMLIFAPGFSTADKVTDLSGRGVGLDVVKSKISSLGGDVSVQTKQGSGTKFTIQLPLTLSIIAAMLVKLGSEKYAFPLSSIIETGSIRKADIKSVHGNFVTEYRSSIIPVLSLAAVVDSPGYREDNEAETEMLVIRKGDKLAAVLVDEFIGQNEIVLKPLGEYLRNLDVVSGATILGDGQVALIIDPNTLIK
ncbi:chemotaxis protein CheA [Cohnella kolymensis]|uniref:Chemotaxis protein CheA n=1 Tax=Cohnella kolymensis TaxID=1590652 RepID=A0ABR5A2L2_9BACL|nr:chemotaxis protein CheA [Cohnella kolymensis]KIL35306.1 chemotaxis protein CheA [Cohnella kolymensis]